MSDSTRLRPDGFSERGAQVTRVEAFVDAAFAFAVTLLVISLDKIPDSAPLLLIALKGIPAFGASFALIAHIWFNHTVWTRRYGLDDGRSVALSLVLVFLMLVYVYPLKIMFAAFFAWISDGWFPANFKMATLDDLRLMFYVYAAAFASVSLVFVALYRRALQLRTQIGLSPREIVLTRFEILGWVSWIAICAISALLTAALDESWPRWTFGMPGMAYTLRWLVGGLLRWRRRGALARLADAGR